MTPVFCIQVVGGVLNDELREALFDAAEKIFKDRKPSAKIKGEGFGGIVRTDWKVGRISAVFGTIFDVVIETERSEIHASYIIYSDLDQGLGRRPEKIENN